MAKKAKIVWGRLVYGSRLGHAFTTDPENSKRLASFCGKGVWKTGKELLRIRGRPDELRCKTCREGADALLASGEYYE